MSGINRRRVLRGMLNGGAVTIGLPLLDCFLNGNGTALADGTKMPIRFGTWFWGLGISASIFVPKKTGADFDLPEEIQALKPVRNQINILSNATAFRDSAPLLCHRTGWGISRTGVAPTSEASGAITYDIKIANDIGRTRRFKTLTTTGGGNARVSYSYEDPNTPNPAEFSPLLFYTRLFGPDFPDPNASNFRPSPRVMARKSVISGVMDEVKALNKEIGVEDRARLDQYFSGLRHLEMQFDQQLTKPEPLQACHPVAETKDADVKLGSDSSMTAKRHSMLADLLAMAVACDQTRVFNMSYTVAKSDTGRPGYDKPFHTATHEEPVDEKLGYQPNVSWFIRRCMEGFAYFVTAFANIREGDGTLLDNTFIVADTEVGYARLHTLDGMPVLTAGRASGKIKSGLHVDLKGTPITRVGYTAMRTMGVDVASFGTGSNHTSSAISEILV